MNLPDSLERNVLICARRSTVFAYFTDSQRFAAWWGAGSTIDGRPGGAMKIIYPGGIVASGQVLEIVEDTRIVFTYGYEDPTKGIAPGESRVTVTLEDRPGGTWVTLRHELNGVELRDQHVQGWRYQLSLFANVAAKEQHSALAQTVDRYFALWGEADNESRLRGLGEIVTGDVQVRDAFSSVCGLDELNAHLAAARIHMPGITLHRSGDPRQCQGTALVDWEAKLPDGKTMARGANVTTLAPDGRIAGVTGFWAG